MQELAKSHAGVPSVEELTLTLRELAPQIARHGTLQLHAVATARRCGRTARPTCTTWSASIRSRMRTLADEDLSIDFAAATPRRSDRVAVVVTAPLTTNEDWTPFAPGELQVFVDGRRAAAPECCAFRS